jgi:hypothetical protein
VFLAGLAAFPFYTPNLICSNKAAAGDVSAQKRAEVENHDPIFSAHHSILPHRYKWQPDYNILQKYSSPLSFCHRCIYLKAFYFIHLGEHLKLMKRLARPLVAIGAHQTQ